VPRAGFEVFLWREHPQPIAELDCRDGFVRLAVQRVEREEALAVPSLRFTVPCRDRMKDSEYLAGWHGSQCSAPIAPLVCEESPDGGIAVLFQPLHVRLIFGVARTLGGGVGHETSERVAAAPAQYRSSRLWITAQA